MATRMKSNKQKRRGRAVDDQLARLQAENTRLRAELRYLRRQETYSSKATKAGPALPVPDDEGFYPAEQTLDVIVANQIIQRRQTAGWTQAELAERAGVRQETVSRIESGKHAPNVSTVDKLDRALKGAGV